MRKFALLLAIVAVFAMSATAFAADGTIAIKGRSSGAESNGLVSGDVTNVYLVSDADPTTVKPKVGVTVTIKTGATTSTIVATDKITTAVLSADFKAIAATVTSGYTSGTEYDQAVEPALEVDTSKKFPTADFGLKYGWTDTSDASKLADGGEKTLVVTPVTACVASDVEFYVGEADKKEAAGLVGDGYTIALTAGHSATAEVTVAISGDPVAGLTAKVSDDLKSIVVESDGNVAEGTYQFTIKATSDGETNITLSEDIADGVKDIKIAGLAEDSLVGVVTVTVNPTAAQDVAKAIAGATTAQKAALQALGNGPVALVMNAAGDAIVSVDVQELAYDYTNTAADAIKITVVSLDLTAATSLDNKITWTDTKALSADVRSDDHVAYIEPVIEDAFSQVLTYTIDPVIFAKDSPIPVTTTEVRAAAPTGFHDVPVDYTITFPKAVGLDPITVTYTTYAKDDSHSSSGACSMGFGLAAIAGLAALALRKRSK